MPQRPFDASFPLPDDQESLHQLHYAAVDMLDRWTVLKEKYVAGCREVCERNKEAERRSKEYKEECDKLKTGEMKPRPKRSSSILAPKQAIAVCMVSCWVARR